MVGPGMRGLVRNLLLDALADMQWHAGMQVVTDVLETKLQKGDGGVPRECLLGYTFITEVDRAYVRSVLRELRRPGSGPVVSELRAATKRDFELVPNLPVRETLWYRRIV